MIRRLLGGRTEHRALSFQDVWGRGLDMTTARTLARYHLLEQVSRIPDRAISVQSEFGQIQLAQPGMNRPTPLPDLNVVLNRHRHRGPTAF